MPDNASGKSKSMIARLPLYVLAYVMLSYFSYQAPEAAQAIRFAYQDRIADAASIVAVQKGLFSAEGLPVKPLRFSSGPATAEALYSGSADIATMGDATAVIAAARKAPVTIIASHGSGEHRHRIVVKPKAEFKEISQLSGKRIAVKKGTSTYGGFLQFLAKHNLDPSKLRIIDMRPADMPEALAAGSIDALVASEPTPSLAESRGAQPFATLGGMGNVYPILIVARTKLLREHPEQATKFLKALARAAAFVNAHADDAAILLSKATGLDEKLVKKAMGQHSYEMRLDASIMRSLEQTARFLRSKARIREIPDLSKATDAMYIQSLQR